MYCEKCGAEIKEGTSFCEKCGTKILQESNTSPLPPRTVLSSDKVTRIPDKGGRKKKMIMGVAIGAAVIAIIGGVFRGIDGRKPDKAYPVLTNATIQSTTFEFTVDRAWATDTIKCPKNQQESFGSKYLTPIDDNAIFYIVEYTFTNTSDQPMDERPSVKLVDSTGIMYDRDEQTSTYVKQGGTSPDYNVYDEAVSISEPMTPGLSLKGQCTFVIAKNRLNENGYIMCSRPQLSANSTVAWLTGIDFGTEEKVGVSLSGFPNDVFKEIEAAEQERIAAEQVEKEKKIAERKREKEESLAYLASEDSGYFKVINSIDERAPLYESADKNSRIIADFPEGTYLSVISTDEETGFLYVRYEGLSETNPYKIDGKIVGFIEKKYVAAPGGEPLELQESSIIDRSTAQGNNEVGDTDYEGNEKMPDSGSINIAEEDITRLSEEDLRIAVNEIYARHGRRFKDANLQAYFDSQPWYQGTIEPEDFDESVLSQIEKDNIKFLQDKMENSVSTGTENSLSGTYEMRFGEDGGTELEITYSAADEFFVSFNGSYMDTVGGAEGIAKPWNSNSNVFLFYREGEEEAILEFQYDGKDQITIESLGGDAMGGMGFPGFSGTYNRTEK